jgi:hypothetical protein
MKVSLQQDEVNLGVWSIFYRPPQGGKYNGKLTVTNRRLLYDAVFDATFKGWALRTLIIKLGSEGYLEIDKAQIQSVEAQRKLLSKKCILTLTDGSKHTFDYGPLNIDKTLAAIEAR